MQFGGCRCLKDNPVSQEQPTNRRMGKAGKRKRKESPYGKIQASQGSSTLSSGVLLQPGNTGANYFWLLFISISLQSQFNHGCTVQSATCPVSLCHTMLKSYSPSAQLLSCSRDREYPVPTCANPATKAERRLPLQASMSTWTVR